MRQNTLIKNLQIANNELNSNSAVERTTVWLNGHFNADLSVVVGI